MAKCEICDKEAGRADVTFDKGPVGTERCYVICGDCQDKMIRYIFGEPPVEAPKESQHEHSKGPGSK